MTPQRRPLPPAGRCHVIGVINLTPDSFSDGGRWVSTDERRGEGAARRSGAGGPAAAGVRPHVDVAGVLAAACAMVREGAAVLDVGAVSTRPGASPVTPEQEWARLAPVLGPLRAAVAVPLSLDTSSSLVLARALETGVDLLNDVAALGEDRSLGPLAAEAGLPVVLMHRRGTPETMQRAPSYADAPAEVFGELELAVARARAAGIAAADILLDPGIGFGKRLQDNLSLLRHLPDLVARGYRVVLGCSRKSFLGALTGRDVNGRESATTATTVLAAQAGVDFVRVHDVAAAVDALAVVNAVVGGDQAPCSLV